MAKGGKGRKGGGGGGGKTRKYSRDNKGRFASTGSGGATARGGRLATAKGNKRKTQTITAKGQKGVLAKPKGLKPGAIKPKAAAAAKLGGRLNPAKKAFRAADKKFLSTIQKEKGISKAASNARRDAKSSSDFTKTPTAKGAKINNTISQTKEKRNITTKQRLLKERLTRAYNLPGNGTDAKGRRTAKIKAKAIATLQGTKRPDISDSAVGGLRRTRTSTGYKAPSSRLPTPSRSARAQGRARALMQTQRRNAKGNRIGNPTKIDRKRLIGARAVNFNKNPKAFLRETLVQEVKSKGAKGTAGFVAKPRSLTQTPKRIKPAAKSAAAKPAAPKPAALSTKAKSPKFTTEQSGRVRRAALGGGRTAIVRKNSAVIINAKGEPIMTRKGLPNITAGKKYAANPNARGPRLMGRDRSEASPSRGYIRTSKPTGTIGKPKGLKPESTNKLKTGIFISKRRAVNAQLANKPDQAVVNIPGRFTGRAGKSFDASITRAVATVKASKDAKFKTKAEVKADQAKAKAAKEAKPKRIRSAESLRVSRAKQIEKRRSITTNPAGVRASAAAKMAANATRTQQRAAAFYKAGGKPAAAKPAAPKAAKRPMR